MPTPATMPSFARWSELYPQVLELSRPACCDRCGWPAGADISAEPYPEKGARRARGRPRRYQAVSRGCPAAQGGVLPGRARAGTTGACSMAGPRSIVPEDRRAWCPSSHELLGPSLGLGEDEPDMLHCILPRTPRPPMVTRGVLRSLVPPGLGRKERWWRSGPVPAEHHRALRRSRWSIDDAARLVADDDQVFIGGE